MSRGWLVVAVAVSLLAVAAPASAKSPRSWRIEFLDTPETLRIDDVDNAVQLFESVHYQYTGGTPVSPEPGRAPAAEFYGDPCNPSGCPFLTYRYFAPRADQPAHMEYYTGGVGGERILYYTWTTPDLQEKVDALRSITAPLDDQAGPTPSFSPTILVTLALAAIALVGAVVYFGRRRWAST